MPQSTQSDNRQIARAAGTVMFAMVLSQLVGLLAKRLTAGAYGTSLESDAFLAANRFSEILFNLVAGGALASAFIPTFTGLLTKDDKPQAWKLASAVTNLVSIALVSVSVLAFIFAPQVVHYILAPGFASSSPEKEQLTVELLRIQLPSSIIFGLSGLVMGILNAHQSFLLPALAPSMYQVGWIIGALVLSPLWGIRGMAAGVVIGACLHLLLQAPALLRLPKRKYSFTLGLQLPVVREVGRLMGPRLLGVAVVQLNFLLNTYLASQQPDGSVAGISFAFPLMIMPQAAIAQSLATAALPTFSAQAARGRLDQMRASLAASLRGVLLLAIPASLGLALLRKPIVALILQTGNFDKTSTELVSWALLWYALGLVGHCVVEIVIRAFFALHDTKTPVMIGVAAMSLNLIFSLVFSALFARIGWMPHGGLALANSLATFLEMTGLLIVMRHRLKGLEENDIWRGVGAALVAASAMSLFLWYWLAVTPAQSVLVITGGGVLIGGLVYLVVLLIFRVREIQQAAGILRRLLSRS